LDQIEPVARIPWMIDEEARTLVVADDIEKADSELLRCGYQVEKNIVERNICAILLRPNSS
jgi:hypothetical protein